MIGQTISHYRILEKLPPTFLKNRTPSGQVGEGGMSPARTTEKELSIVRSGGQNGPRTCLPDRQAFFVSVCRFEDPPSVWRRRGL